MEQNGTYRDCTVFVHTVHGESSLTYCICYHTPVTLLSQFDVFISFKKINNNNNNNKMWLTG